MTRPVDRAESVERARPVELDRFVEPGRRCRTVPAAAAALLAGLALNAALAFENWWPTPAIRPLAQFAPEFILLWLVLLLADGLRGPGASARALPGPVLTGLAAGYLLLVVGRYVDVTAPALYGRAFSWYWDAPHLPGLLAAALDERPAGLLIAIGGGLVLAWLAAIGVLRALIAHLAAVVPAARRSLPGRIVTALAIVLVAGKMAGLPPAGHWVAPSVLGGWWLEARLAWHASRPGAMADVLPPSPPFDSDLAQVHDTDVMLIFAESYGAATIDDPALAGALAPARRQLASAIEAAGLTAISAQVRSPTFGGGSWLAHAALLGGIDTRDPRRYPLLLASERDNLVRLFSRHGRRTIAVMPGTRTSWPEGRFYRYDRLLDAEALDYQGPAFGFWRIPDQFSIARLEADTAQARAAGDRRPHFAVVATISSHLPFDPVPPLQPDWSRLTGPEPYDASALAEALAREADWLALREPYRRSLDYSFGWLAQWLQRPAPRERLVIIVGDHQPAAQVSGRQASWNVPVHVLARNPVIIERLRRTGFVDGLAPAAPELGDLPWLLRQLLVAMDGRERAALPLEHP